MSLTDLPKKLNYSSDAFEKTQKAKEWKIIPKKNRKTDKVSY